MLEIDKENESWADIFTIQVMFNKLEFPVGTKRRRDFLIREVERFLEDMKSGDSEAEI